MNATIGQKIGAGFALVLLVFSIFAVVAFRELARSTETVRLVGQTHEVIGEIVQIEASVADIQSAARGYALTGEESQVEGIEWNRLELTQSVEELRSLTTGDRTQAERHARLVPLVGKFLEFSDWQVETQQSGGLAASIKLARTGEGQQSMEAVLMLLAELKDAEERLLETRTTTARESVAATRRVLGLTAALALAFGIGAALFISRRLSARLGELVEGAGALGGGSLSHRVPVTSSDQLGQLAAAFNQMAGRLETSQEELRAQAAELAQTSRYKSQFLSNVSHELRTPLNSLMILSQMLGENAEGTLTARQVEWARTIHGSGGDLLALINDVLDLARIEAGKLSIERRAVAFDELRDSLVRTFRPLAEKQALTFDLRLAPELPASFETDGKRLLQILNNLLANAFKFTARGSVALAIEAEPDAFTFAVRDTGIGIPAGKQQLIFDAFQQAETGTARKYGGTGLGLSISRELARLLGGALTLQSAEGAGSTFTLRLPRVCSAAAPAIVAPPRAPTPEPREMAEDVSFPRDDYAPISAADEMLAGRTVLVVDDDVRNVFALTAALERLGMRVIPAETGLEALAQLDREPGIELVLMDVMMPEMDGLECTRRLRADPRWPSLPVIAVTAKAMKGSREQCLEAGANDYLSKPVDMAQLRALLRQWLAR